MADRDTSRTDADGWTLVTSKKQRPTENLAMQEINSDYGGRHTNRPREASTSDTGSTTAQRETGNNSMPRPPTYASIVANRLRASPAPVPGPSSSKQNIAVTGESTAPPEERQRRRGDVWGGREQGPGGRNWRYRDYEALPAWYKPPSWDTRRTGAA
ncbi:hypothetical protein SAMD00023353_0601650 [Rosellinia necatrix]|uniref:Uncharacterized protein n=1 Tax=Rosellinia necatrix TaxID=77044 RepID=A0A1S7ULW9_ROSNE|nr:hypothetical protein SAMD00023353_0601650 [Rosellinia necatrix]